MDNKKKRNPLWIIGAVIAVFFGKLKALVPLLKLGKVGGALISMAVSIGAYAYFAPLPFAVGFVLLLFVHEMGHVLAARRKGLPVTAPIFIPFLGALINMKKHPRDAVTEAYIGIGGPVLGSIGAAVLFFAGWLWHYPLLLSLAYTGFFLNLINLLPIHPLDGGRISVAVTRWLWLVGLVGGLVLIIYMKSILFFIIWASFAWDLYKKYVKHRKNAERHTLPMRVDLQIQDWLAQTSFMIPGENHQRDLPFTTYSSMDGLQSVEFSWEGLGLYHKIELNQQAVIHKIRVVRVERKSTLDQMHLLVHCQMDYAPYESDSYYEVPAGTRWAFGSVYFLLAAALLGMMYWTHRLGVLY